MNKAEKANGNIKSKLPFAIFVCAKEKSEEMIDYKQTIARIISDRIQERFR